MSLKQRVSDLATGKHMSIAELERTLNFANGSIGKWDKQSPSGERLQAVATFFDVSVDYLLGRSDKKHYYDLSEKEEKDLAVLAQKMLDGTTEEAEVNFEGEPMTEEAKANLRTAILTALEINKRAAKKSFTPKKYRGSESDKD